MPTWDRPSLESKEIDVLDELKARDRESARMFSGGGDGSQPTGSMRWDNSDNVFQRWVDSSWSNRQLAISGGGTGSSSASGARSNLNVYSTGQVDSEISNLDNKIDELEAEDISYDNTESGLGATDVQDAIDELAADTTEDASDIVYDNTESGLSSDNVQDAIDETYQFAEDLEDDISAISPQETVAGDDVIASQRVTTHETDIDAWRTVISWMPILNGSIRIRASMRHTDVGGSGVSQGRVLINGSQSGSIYTGIRSNTNFGTSSQDFNVSAGDVVQFQFRISDTDRTCFIDNNSPQLRLQTRLPVPVAYTVADSPVSSE